MPYNVPTYCVSCGTRVQDKTVEDNYAGPPKLSGCCEDCFPTAKSIAPVPVVVAQPEAVEPPKEQAAAAPIPEEEQSA